MDKEPVVRKTNKVKKRLAAGSGDRRFWREFFIWGIAVFSCTFGALSAFLLTATPLKNSSHLPNSPDNLSSIIPANLTRPINVLMLGIDNSGHPHLGNYTPAEALWGNSDTMLLVRLYPDTHQINILSIPRDTLVQMPDIGIDKINDANVRGGAKLAAQTVSHLLSDIPIDRYVRLDTEGFIHLIDALGGVEVTIPKPMHYVDETQHLYINFKAGQQKLNGQHLQEYVRFRHDELGDIGRVQRQQVVLRAILNSLLQPSTLGQLPQILQVVKDNVDTDLSIGEMLAIAQILGHTDRQHINMVMLPGRFSEKNEYSLSYWIKNPQATAAILASYFDVPNYQVQTVRVSPNIKPFRIAVLNATGRKGQAAKALAFLKKQGFSNIYISSHEVDSVTIPVLQTQIVAQTGNLEAAETVKNAMGLGQVQVASTGDIWSDVTVVVGTDFAAKLNN